MPLEVGTAEHAFRSHNADGTVAQADLGAMRAWGMKKDTDVTELKGYQATFKITIEGNSTVWRVVGVDHWFQAYDKVTKALKFQKGAVQFFEDGSIARNGSDISSNFTVLDVVSGQHYEAGTLSDLVLNCPEDLQSLGLALPPEPKSGQRFSLTTTHVITQLFLNPNNNPISIVNAPTTAAAGDVFTFRYSSSQNKWYRAG